VVVHSYNPSTERQRQENQELELHRKTLSQRQKIPKINMLYKGGGREG
jgi:hypothetical protein